MDTLEKWVGFYLLVIALSMCLLQTAGTESTMKIEARPPDINMIDIKPLTIECTFVHDANATNKISLQSLILSRRITAGGGQIGAAFDTISELNLSKPNSPNTHNFRNSGITSVSGHMTKDKGISLLSVTWSTPTQKETGTFACTAHTLDSQGVATTELHETEVREDSILVLGQKLKSLQKDTEQQKTCCHLATARLTEFEVWREIVSTSVQYFADKLVFERSGEYNGSRSYLVSSFIVDDMKVADAVCQTMGGYLAEVDDAQEWAFITDFLKLKINATLTTSQFLSVLIGGRDDVEEGNWYWMHSRRPLTFAPWVKGEPNNHGGAEDCMELRVTDIQTIRYGLNDILCTYPNRFSFICEIPKDGHV